MKTTPSLSKKNKTITDADVDGSLMVYPQIEPIGKDKIKWDAFVAERLVAHKANKVKKILTKSKLQLELLK